MLGVVLIALIATLTSSASAVGPYPDLGSCQVFPDPPASLSPRAPSLATEAAWNQDISKAPRDPRSGAYIAYISAHGGDFVHPDSKVATLVVNDLKSGAQGKGGVALWIDRGTIAHFRDLSVEPE